MTTFSKLKSGDWGVRSDQRLSPGSTVTVTKKDGSTQQVVVEKIVWTDGKVVLAAIKAEPRVRATGAALELAFAVHLRGIAQKEGMDGQPIDKYVDLVRQQRFNLRACLQEIESGSMCVC